MPDGEAVVDIIDRREVDHTQRPRLDLAGWWIVPILLYNDLANV